MLEFTPSTPLTLGVELELQLLSTHDYDMTPYAPDMLALLKNVAVPGAIVPEVTASMIEISTGICQDAQDAWRQLALTRDALVKAADRLNIAVVGGGTHPFQQWHQQRIYDKPRFHGAVGAVRLPDQAVHHLRPARARGLPGRGLGAVHAALHVALAECGIALARRDR